MMYPLTYQNATNVTTLWPSTLLPPAPVLQVVFYHVSFKIKLKSHLY